MEDSKKVINLNNEDKKEDELVQLLYSGPGETITQEFLKDIIGKYISVPNNIQKVRDPLDLKEKEVNNWFAGKVAGYSISTYGYDFVRDEYYDEPVTLLNIILTDGASYLTNPTTEITEISKETFYEMLAEHDVDSYFEQLKEERDNIILGKGDRE